MLTPEETISWIKQRISYIHERPLMYGGTVEGVHACLYFYLELWAVIVGDRDYFVKNLGAVWCENEYGSVIFGTRFRIDNSSASDEEVLQFLLNCWREVQKRMELQIEQSTDTR